MTGFVLFFFNLENDSGITYNYKYLETKSESVSRWVLSLFGILWPASSVRGILQAKILEWVGISFSRGSS